MGNVKRLAVRSSNQLYPVILAASLLYKIFFLQYRDFMPCSHLVGKFAEMAEVVSGHGHTRRGDDVTAFAQSPIGTKHHATLANAK